jgi:protoheme ferro-lyase
MDEILEVNKVDQRIVGKVLDNILKSFQSRNQEIAAAYVSKIYTEDEYNQMMAENRSRAVEKFDRLDAISAPKSPYDHFMEE